MDGNNSEPLKRSYSDRNPDRKRDLNCRDYAGSRKNCCNQQNHDEKNDSFNNHYRSSTKKHETLNEEFDILYSNYHDVMEKLDKKHDEIERLQQRLNDVMSQYRNASLEVNGLKQQCTQTVQKWQFVDRELHELKIAYADLQQKYDLTVTSCTQAKKEINVLTGERDTAVDNYNLVMKERGIFHKEMEALSENYSKAENKIHYQDKQIKELMKQNQTLNCKFESLDRELDSALYERDKAVKENNEFRKKFGEFTAKEESHREVNKSKHNYSYVSERECDQKDSNEMLSSTRNSFTKCQKEMHNLDQANQEIERLQNLFIKQQTDLQEALQEAEVSKRRRDWAFNERDKIILQRESLKTMLEQIRKERDRDKIQLAEALRDSGENKRRFKDVTKELLMLKDNMENRLDKDGLLQLNSTNHNNSLDSAIDTDLQEWDTELLKIDISNLSSIDDLGLELGGGRDDPYYQNGSGIYVCSICKGSPLERKLKVNDCIMRVNNLECFNVSFQDVLETIFSSDKICNIVVKRRRIGSRSLFTTQLQLNNYDHGLSLDMGMYISKIIPGSLSAREGNLAVGDRVLSINNKTMDGLKSIREAMNILNKSSDTLVITTLKSTHCSSNCGSNSNRDVYKKYANSSTQTKSSNISSSYYIENRNNVNSSKSVNQIMINEKKQLSQKIEKWEPFTSVDYQIINNVKPSLNPSRYNSLTVPDHDHMSEEVAVAHLDSVINYHEQDEHDKEMEKNSGTWPKARMAPVTYHPSGTVLNMRKTKERAPLSLFLGHSNYNNTSQPRYNYSPSPGQMKNNQSLDFTMKSSARNSIDNKEIQQNIGSNNIEAAAHFRSRSQVYSSYTPYVTSPLFVSQYQSSHSGDSLSLTESRSCCYNNLNYESLNEQKYLQSTESQYSRFNSRPCSGSQERGDPAFRLSMDQGTYKYEGSTFPRKKESLKFRNSSNTSVASKISGKLSTSSIEKSSERMNSMPIIHVEVLGPRQDSFRTSMNNKYCTPNIGEERRIRIENCMEPLGILIKCSTGGAVFISNVPKHGLASRVGLQVGDQLIEVGGINMRNASYKCAERVLAQCKNNILLHVQYNPHKYHNAVFVSDGSATSGEESRSETHSGSPTPRNSPKVNRKTPSASICQNPYTHTVTTLMRRPKQIEKNPHEFDAGTLVGEPRYLILETQKCSDLGIRLVGGNAVGIFVHTVTSNSVAYNAGLRTGDQILNYNGTDLTQATAEEASLELAKPADKVSIVVQNKLDRYNQIKDRPGDSFYVRAMFDRTGDLGDSNQLQFKKDDILFVDNTMLNGVPGYWRAALIKQNEPTQTWGIIPSRLKVEEELAKRNQNEFVENNARRLYRSGFFLSKRRSKKRKDPKELASYSNTTGMDWLSESGSLNEDIVASYQRVIRLNTKSELRPVVIAGPLADCVAGKLINDFPEKFNRCIPEIYHSPCMEQSDDEFIECRKKGREFECITMAALNHSSDGIHHCILDVNLANVRKLHHNRIYPIVLFIKFKSAKQLKEFDTHVKATKEMHEHAMKLELEYKHFISAVIPAGANFRYMCTQIVAAVDSEQCKAIWVPDSVNNNNNMP